MNIPVANAVAAQNILSGEKTFKSVQFAVTGSALADAVAGVQAVLAGENLLESAKASLLRMLAEVYQWEHDNGEEQRRTIERLQQPAYPPQQYPGLPQQQSGYNSTGNALANIGVSAMPSMADIAAAAPGRFP